MLTRQRLSAALQLTSSEVFCLSGNCSSCTSSLVDSFLGEGDDSQVWIVQGKPQVLRFPKDAQDPATFEEYKAMIGKHLFLTRVLDWERVFPCLVIPCIRGVKVHNACGQWCPGSVIVYNEDSQLFHHCVEQKMDVVKLLIAVCECLQRLRSLLNFRHNDLHMKNILVHPDGNLTLIDLDSCTFRWRGFEFYKDQRSPGFDMWCLFRDLFRHFPLIDARLSLEKRHCQLRRNMFKFRPSMVHRRLIKLLRD